METDADVVNQQAAGAAQNSVAIDVNSSSHGSGDRKHKKQAALSAHDELHLKHALLYSVTDQESDSPATCATASRHFSSSNSNNNTSSTPEGAAVDTADRMEVDNSVKAAAVAPTRRPLQRKPFNAPGELQAESVLLLYRTTSFKHSATICCSN